MDISNAHILKGTNFFCNLSSCRPYPTSSIHCRNNPLRKTTDQSFPFLKIPFWSSFNSTNSRVLRVSAHFRRPVKRRNSLREKLIRFREEQVRNAPEPVIFDSSLPNSGSHIHDYVESIESDVNLDPEVGGVGVENFDLSRNSALRDELENWVAHHKKDSEFWGVGSGPVFTICQDSDGNVISATVNEDEIAKRSQIRTRSPGEKERVEEYIDVKSKISHAKSIAKEIEAGEYAISRNSSIAKFVVEGRNSSLVEGFHSAALRTRPLLMLFSRTGLILLCGWVVFWAVTKIFVRSEKVELTREEVEMLRRKKKSRMEKEEAMKGSVKVLQNMQELPMASGKRPQLDRNELINSLMQAKKLRENSVISGSSSFFDARDPDFDRKVSEIREMARKVRESERQDHAEIDEEGIDDDVLSEVPAAIIENTFEDSSDSGTTSLQANDIRTESENLINNVPDGRLSTTFRVEKVTPVTKVSTEIISESGTYLHDANASKDRGAIGQFEKDRYMLQERETDNSSSDSVHPNTGMKPKIIRSVKKAREYLGRKSKIPRAVLQNNQAIRFNKPAKSFGTDNVGKLLDKHGQKRNRLSKAVEPSKLEKPCDVKVATGSDEPSYVLNAASVIERPLINPISGGQMQKTDILEHNKTVKAQNLNDGHGTVWSLSDSKALNSSGSSSGEAPILGNSRSKITLLKNECEGDGASQSEDYDNLEDTVHFSQGHVGNAKDGIDISEVKLDEPGGNKDTLNNSEANVVQPSDSYMAQDSSDGSEDLESCVNAAITGNFEDQHSIKSGTSPPQLSKGTSAHNEAKKPVAEKRWLEKNFDELNPVIEKIRAGFKDNYMVAKEKAQEMSSLSTNTNDLKFIVEDEELAWMNDDNLLEIVFHVRENELAGRDPFHLMDADDKRAFFEGLERKAEKVNEKLQAMHEWIHSRVENLDYGADSISLDDPLEKIIPRWKGPALDEDDFRKGLTEQKKAFRAGVAETAEGDSQDSLQKSDDFPNSDNFPYIIRNGNSKVSSGGSSPSPKTTIEGSDGSSRAGKKTGKEHWQHTKRWSQGFLDVYNAETDPEMKSIMKDMGKDLDRWITEKETQDVADLMTRIPKKKRRYIENKMDKLKREMQMFGAQAVVSKYREYADEEEEDYLWWLDLEFVLCIELYTIEDGKAKVGFYSLEMAADLELEPKQYHVIAFEDPGDSKNFCYILQSHMDMLGSGRAFVVARPPKDVFREAKADGFNITVIRKGEFKLNVDQTLEEVEEEITEVGSKPYHDLIMRERAVDIRTMMKGVFKADKSTKRIPKRRLKKPAGS